jgi:N-formylglutamate amidohydrolase
MEEGMIHKFGRPHKRLPVIFTLPHNGETVPPEASWLHSIPKNILMTDVDRYVDQLYRPILEKDDWPYVTTEVHRYAVDLNRIPEDIDPDSVEGSENKRGSFSKGFHWVMTTTGYRLMTLPISPTLHQLLTDKYYIPFHRKVQQMASEVRAAHPNSALLHFDLHSMPSKGTTLHFDPGGERAEVVLSDFEGRSSDPSLMDWVFQAFQSEGFHVVINEPYKGGRITQVYGQPLQGHHTIQIELNRKLYMDEQGDRNKNALFDVTQTRLQKVFDQILSEPLALKLAKLSPA